ncbi:MAG: cytochrome b561 [Gammaproteobacteria bacterium]|jgi:cytochrome b561
MADLTYYDSLYQILPEIHQSIGLILAGFWCIRLCWKRVDVKPELPSKLAPVMRYLASFVHWAMLSLIPLILISGYLITKADGSNISIFGLIDVPATITSIERQEDIAGWLHKYLAYLIMIIVLLHVLASLKHHFINKDNTLRRILGR